MDVGVVELIESSQTVFIYTQKNGHTFNVYSYALATQTLENKGEMKLTEYEDSKINSFSVTASTLLSQPINIAILSSHRLPRIYSIPSDTPSKPKSNTTLEIYPNFFENKITILPSAVYLHGSFIDSGDEVVLIYPLNDLAKPHSMISSSQISEFIFSSITPLEFKAKDGKQLVAFLTNTKKSAMKVYTPMENFEVEIMDGPHQGRVPGVANIGLRPTFEKTVPILEAHLFDFDGDLYGAEIAVALLSFIRPERRFDGLEALTAQIAADVSTARDLTGSRS